MLLKIEYITGIHPNQPGDLTHAHYKFKYVKEENIEKIVTSDDSCFRHHRSKDGELHKYLGKLFSQVFLKDRETIEMVINITYPINDTNVEIDSVSVNQHTDISNLSSVLNKLDETLNKILDKGE